MPTLTPTMTSFQPASQQVANPAVLANGLTATGLNHPDFRPLRGVPIYPNMASMLADSTTNHPDPDIAYMLAVCSAYSYSNIDTLAEIMSILGLEQNHCQIFNRVVDGLLIDSTAFLVRDRDRKIAILSYRGTSPVNFNHWLIDADVVAEKVGSPGFPNGQVHAGFYRNTRATQRMVIDALRAEPFDTLYITGHSLGAATAALMAVTLRGKSQYPDLSDKIKAIYTFGQPMVGDPDFAEACQLDSFLRDKIFRFIHKHDIVPHLPPTVSGCYQHFGREYRYQASMVPSGIRLDISAPSRCSPLPFSLTTKPSRTRLGLDFPFIYRSPRLWPRTGAWRDTSRHPVRQVLGIYEIANSFFEFAARRVRLAQAFPFRYSLEDHLPRHYIHATWEAISAQTQEFGQ